MNQHAKTYILVLVLIFSLSAVGAADWNANYHQALALLERRPAKPAQVQAIFQSLPAPWQQVLLVEQARIEGNAKEATRRLDRLLADPATDSWEADALVALGMALSGAGRPEQALNVLTQVYARTGDMRKARAAVAAADVEAAQDGYEDALTWLNRARMALQEDYSYTADPAMLALIDERRQRYEHLRDAMRHGLGYVLLKRARQQRAAGAREQALATLDELLLLAARNQKTGMSRSRLFATSRFDENLLRQAPIEQAYEETAAFLRCRLLFELGQTARGRKGLDAFRVMYPCSVYLGEVAVLFGDEELYAGGNPAVALQYYDEAAAWLQDDAAMARAASGFNVPEDAVDVVAPPKFITRTDDWGNRAWSRMQPDDLFNVSTCSWYRQFALTSVFAKRALCYHLLGKRDLAVADLDAMAKIDPASAGGGISDFFSRQRRLTDDFRAGRLYALPAEAAAFTGRSSTRLSLADLNTELELWDEAADAYAAMQEGAPVAARAYLSYMLAFCDVQRGRVADANRRLDAFFAAGEFTKTVSWVRAMVLRSDLQAGQSKVATLLEALARCPPDMALSIRFRIGQQAFCLGSYRVAREHLAVVVRQASEGDSMRIGATDLLEYMSTHPAGILGH